MNIVVIGAGVNGLACALRIQMEVPFVQVTVLSEEFSPNTTGDGSAGFWEPYHTGNTDLNLVRRWSDVTYKHLMKLIHSGKCVETGVSWCTGSQFSDREQELPYWWDVPCNFHKLTKSELERRPGFASGYSFTTIICEPVLYLPWMLKKFVDAGGKYKQIKVNSLRELSDYDVIINCTGLASYELLSDKELFPVRGQVIKVKAPWITKFSVLNDVGGNTITYIIPGQNCVTLGGTAEEGNWSKDVCPEAKKAIWDRSCLLEPSLKNAETLNDWAHLRPVRSSVRLEKETFHYADINKPITVIHNYGHGGCGVTIHWGCAEDVLQLVRKEIISKQSRL